MGSLTSRETDPAVGCAVPQGRSDSAGWGVYWLWSRFRRDLIGLSCGCAEGNDMYDAMPLDVLVMMYGNC